MFNFFCPYYTEWWIAYTIHFISSFAISTSFLPLHPSLNFFSRFFHYPLASALTINLSFYISSKYYFFRVLFPRISISTKLTLSSFFSPTYNSRSSPPSISQFLTTVTNQPSTKAQKLKKISRHFQIIFFWNKSCRESLLFLTLKTVM